MLQCLSCVPTSRKASARGQRDARRQVEVLRQQEEVLRQQEEVLRKQLAAAGNQQAANTITSESSRKRVRQPAGEGQSGTDLLRLAMWARLWCSRWLGVGAGVYCGLGKRVLLLYWAPATAQHPWCRLPRQVSRAAVRVEHCARGRKEYRASSPCAAGFARFGAVRCETDSERGGDESNGGETVGGRRQRLWAVQQRRERRWGDGG